MVSPDMELLLDRLLSASTPSDCLDSLDALQNACRSSSEAVDAILENNGILRALCHLISNSTLPTIGEDGEGMKVEGGEIGSAELVLLLLPDPSVTSSNAAKATTEELNRNKAQQRKIEHISKSLLLFHQHIDELDSLGLTSSLLDCLCSNSAVYARVLSLQILSALLQASPGVLREQLMQAPDGINRLVDLLGHSPTNDAASGEEEPEEVRNASILFLTKLASSSSVLARLITFSEGYSRALKIGLSLSHGESVTIDCLGLCVALANADDVGRELFLGGGDGKGNLERLAQMMDLRKGERFRNEERNAWWSEELRKKRQKKDDSDANDRVDKGDEQKKKSKRGKRKDDLDDILSGTDAVSTKGNITSTSSNAMPVGPPIPYLTPNETTTVDLICNLLLVLLYDGESPDISSRSITEQSALKRRARAKEIASHDLLTRSIVDCALYTLPPPGVNFVSAAPPPMLQIKALMVMAVLGSMGDMIESGKSIESNSKRVDEDTQLQTYLLFETMPLYLQGRVTAMERLMYLACTGAYRPQNEEDESPEATASLISMNAISVFRSCLPAETACRMVLHALAPPPPDETEEAVDVTEMPVVMKLATTLVENLRFLQSNQHHVQINGAVENPDFDITAIYSATIGASGAADALGVLLTKGEGDTTREMLLRIIPPPPPPLDPEEVKAGLPEPIASSNLIDFAIQFIACYDHSGDSTQNSTVGSAFQKSMAYVVFALLRFLTEWIEGMPKAVSEVLSSPSSVSLGVLVRAKNKNAVPAMSGLLLGLCLDHMTDTGSSILFTNAEHSAWTKDTIVNMIQSIGVRKYFGILDEWKNKSMPLPYCSSDLGPILERRAVSSWYGHNATQVRRRIVATMTGDSGDCDVDSDVEGENVAGSNIATRSLRVMVKSQAKEMEEIQSRLDEALRIIESQAFQVKSLKRLAELGASVETNDMLTEYVDEITVLKEEKVQMLCEVEKKATFQKETLAAKEQEIASLQIELQQTRIAVAESERDKEILREEMTGLSAAYNSLEQEYRSNNFNSAGNMREIKTSDGAANEGKLTSLPGGENNDQLQLLQNENAQLREDVRAANEWMTMAVSKMDEMGRDNESLSKSLQQKQNQPIVLSSQIKEKDDELSQQKMIIQELQDRNNKVQESMGSAVARVDALTKEVEELKTRNAELEAASNVENAIQSELDEVKAQNVNLTLERETLQSTLTEFQSWSKTAQDHLAEMESALQQVTSERDELKNNPGSPSDDTNAQIESMRAELAVKTEELNDINRQLKQNQAQLSEESDANRTVIENLRDELNQQKQLFEAMTTEKNELMAQAASREFDLSSNRVAELEVALQEITTERDKLRISAQSSSSRTSEQIESLQTCLKTKTNELSDARSQLEQMNSQLIAESNAKEETVEKLRDEVEAGKQCLQILEAEKEKLAAMSLSKQTEIDSIYSENASLNAKIELMNQSIAELKVLEDKLVAVTADRNEIKIRFENVSKECERTRQTFEQIQMENGNLTAKNRSLEQDKKSLENQFAEASSISAENSQLRRRITELEEAASLSQEEKLSLQDALDDMQNSSEEAVKLWKERADELELNIQSLESQMKDQEDEAIQAIAQWEERCSSLEYSKEDAVQKWQERSQSLESQITSLQNEISSLNEQNATFERLLAENAQKVESEDTEKKESIASFNEQIDLLTKELIATREESEQVVQQWQDRSKELEASIDELNESLANQQVEATDVISQWEARCAALNERIEDLESQLVNQVPIAELQDSLSKANQTLEDKDKELARLTSELGSLQSPDAQNEMSCLISQLEDTRCKLNKTAAEYDLLRQTLIHKESEHSNEIKRIVTEKDEALLAAESISGDLTVRIEEMQRRLTEANEKMALQSKELFRGESTQNNHSTSSQNNVTLQVEFNRLTEMIHALEVEKSQLAKEKNEVLQEAEESNVLINELKEELRCAQEEIHSFATDQLSTRANEIASHALRQSMLEVRSQYEADRKSFATEHELRLAAEEEVKKLKSDIALLSQATGYDENVDLHVQNIAKKMAAENTRKERHEMEELRFALDQLKEELGTCRWKEREAEEKAANARLQKSILEQEVCAAKSDMALMEQAIEDLETSKIDVCVSMEYRIKTLLNERSLLEKSYNEEFALIKTQLAKVHQEKDNLIHRLEQSEKANAALSSNTVTGNDVSESEVAMLQLEKVQLLAKIAEIGVDSERRIREAVAVHASAAEAELIIETQAKKAVERSLADALSELQNVKSQLVTKSTLDESRGNDVRLTELTESLVENQLHSKELQAANEELKKQMADATRESQSLIESLKEKLIKAEKRVRDKERENRFEAALALEIARLRDGASSLNRNVKSSGNMSSPEMESISENILAMHEYVVELRAMRDEERKLHQIVVAERDDALELLGQFHEEFHSDSARS